jgi:hypothetical protein
MVVDIAHEKWWWTAPMKMVVGSVDENGRG